jgi:hypothetical protein
MQIEAIRDDPEAAETIAALEKARAHVEEQLKEYEAKEAGFWNIAKMAGMVKVYDTYSRSFLMLLRYRDCFSSIQTNFAKSIYRQIFACLSGGRNSECGIAGIMVSAKSAIGPYID